MCWDALLLPLPSLLSSSPFILPGLRLQGSKASPPPEKHQAGTLPGLQWSFLMQHFFSALHYGTVRAYLSILKFEGKENIYKYQLSDRFKINSWDLSVGSCLLKTNLTLFKMPDILFRNVKNHWKKKNYVSNPVFELSKLPLFHLKLEGSHCALAQHFSKWLW